MKSESDARRGDPTYIYLDLNKWIDLARAWHDRPGGLQHQETLRTLQKGLDAGLLRLPFSAEHVIEISAISNLERRKRLVEVFVMDFSGDLYGKTIGVEFIKKVRDQEKFDGLDALVKQINQDVDDCRQVLAVSRSNSDD